MAQLPPQETELSGAQGAAALGGVQEPGHAGLQCEDEQEACPEWAAGEGCLELGPSFMLESCRRSCGVCGRPSNASVPQMVRPSFPCMPHMSALACSRAQAGLAQGVHAALGGK